jgi:hypothetical protein
MKPLISLLIAVAFATLAQAQNVAGKAESGEDVAISKCLTIQANGPRPGDAGAKHFNIQGKDNGRFASFGVLVFDLP